MFKIKQSKTFVWPVKITVPIDGGKYSNSTFDVEFDRISQSAVEQLASSIQNEEQTAVQIVKSIIVGWPDGSVTDGTDSIPFSDSALDELLDVPGVASAIITSFLEAYNGQAAKRKN